MILVLGDVHCQWRALEKQYEKANDLFPGQIDAIVQLGDFGVHPEEWESFTGTPVPLYFIDGNHEHFPFLQKLAKVDHTVVRLNKRNCYYIPRGASFQLEGRRWLGLGGCRLFSPVNCPPGSLFTEEQIKRCLNKDDIEIIITHDGPKGLGIPGHPAFGGGMDVGAEQLLSLYDLKPKLWLFAHHHITLQMENRGVRHYCLDCCDQGFGLLEPQSLTYNWKSHQL